MIALEYIGQPGPHRDAKGWVERIRAAHPGISDIAVEGVLRRANAKYRPRLDMLPWVLFGADIMADDLTSIDAWAYLDIRTKAALQAYPVHGGELITENTPGRAMTLKRAIDTYGQHGVNRASLMVPAGLSKTYVWCKANGFVQNVTDADAAIIRSTPVLNQCFRSASNADTALQYERFEREPVSRMEFRSLAEAEAYERESERRTYHKGVTL